MNSKVSREMEIYFPIRQETKKSIILNDFYGICMSYLFFSVITQTFLRVFAIECHALWLQGVGLAVIAGVSLLYNKKWFLPVFALAGTSAFAVCMAVKAGLLVQGMNLVVNRVLYALGIKKNITFLQYAITCKEDQYADHAFLFLFFPTLLFAAFSVGIIRSCKKLGLLFCISAFALVLYLQTADLPLLPLGLVLCIVLLLGADFVGNTRWKHVQGMQLSRQVLCQALLILLLSAAGMAVTLLPIREKGEAFAKGCRKDLTQAVRELRYEKNIPNTFTQGDFTRLTDLELYEVPALQIQMEKPDSYYLRGYVGSSYTAYGWKTLEKEQIYNHYPLYYWLKENNFDETAQLSGLEAVTEGTSLPTQIHIKNLNANSEYLYTPYELASVEEDQVLAVGQGSIVSKKLFGHRDYTYQVTDNLLVRYPALWQKLDDADYKQNELNEREWVYDTYLDIPSEVKGTLRQLIGEQQSGQTGHVTYQEAEKLIKTYLEKNITYSMTIEPWDQQVDFVTDFLKNSKTGYSVHYATTATLMFRYLGIPSRYVEGYLVTPEDVAGKKSGEEIEIQGKNGHAWTEIYQDGIGWIPVEVTPAYYGIMDVAQIPPQVAQSGTKREEPQEEAGDLPQDVEPPEQALEPQESGLLEQILRVTGILLLVLLAAGIIGSVMFILLRRHYRKKRRNKQFEDEDSSLAVCRMFAYIEDLLKYEGIHKKGISPITYEEEIREHISNAYAKQFLEIWRICQSGAFSTHQVSEEQRKLVYEYQEKLLEKIAENKKWYQRWSMKYIKCFY